MANPKKAVSNRRWCRWLFPNSQAVCVKRALTPMGLVPSYGPGYRDDSGAENHLADVVALCKEWRDL